VIFSRTPDNPLWFLPSCSSGQDLSVSDRSKVRSRDFGQTVSEKLYFSCLHFESAFGNSRLIIRVDLLDAHGGRCTEMPVRTLGIYVSHMQQILWRFHYVRPNNDQVIVRPDLAYTICKDHRTTSLVQDQCHVTGQGCIIGMK
jgi:hypothetical protein